MGAGGGPDRHNGQARWAARKHQCSWNKGSNKI
jgi:hypothetical protein